MSERDPRWGTHYREPIARLRQGLAGFEASFRELLLGHPVADELEFKPELVRDPLPYRGGPLRFTPSPSNTRLIETLLRCAEDFARYHAEDGQSRQSMQARLDDALADVQRLQTSEAKFRLMHDRLERDHAAISQSRPIRLGHAALAPVRWLKRNFAMR